MTELLYFSSDQLTVDATVQACVTVQNGYEVILNQTVFHSQGGGQPSDVGHMGAARVTKVVERNGNLVHCIDARLEIGVVGLQVDKDARLLHSRLHTAGHLIGHAVAPLGFIATRAHHWPGEARVDVSPTAMGVACLSINELQSRVDALIAQDLPRVLRLHEGFREIGFGELPAFPCGGTHVISTGMVGSCVINDIGKNGNGFRIRYAVI